MTTARISEGLPLILIVIVIPTLTACGAPPATPTPAPTAQVERPIIDGIPDTNPAHKAVVALTWGSGPDNFCSGTLITPDVVLTAAHCLDGIAAPATEVFFGNDVSQAGERREAVELIYHPLWDDENLAHGYDLGLIRLDAPAPADATPIPYLPAALGLTPTDEGTPLEFVGFGRTENDTSGLKLTALAVMARICDGPNPCSWAGASIAPGGLFYPMDDGGPCKGDSGGPAFLWRNGQEYVAGVTSYGDEFCDYYGVSTRPDSHADWIEAFIAGVQEDCTAPGDEDHDTLADCADPDCDEHPACTPTSCGVAEEITCGDTITGTTVGGSYQLRQYNCYDGGLELGPERAYVIAAPRGLDVYVTLHSDDGVDLDLFVLPWFGNDCVAWYCDDGSASPGDVSEQLSFHARNDHGFIVVDSADVPGAYTLIMACDTSAEDCTNHIDDDADGLLDCDDDECAQHPDCAPPPEQCANYIDDDGDGLTDCDDPDCTDSALCNGGKKGGCQQAPSGAPGIPTLPMLLVIGALFALLRRSR